MFTWPVWGTIALWIIIPLGSILAVMFVYLEYAKRVETDWQREDAQYEADLAMGEEALG